MASLQSIRRRITSVKSTQQVTKAMKMVSASKLRRSQEVAEAARPYARKMAEMFAGLGIDPAQATHPLLVPRQARRVAVLVITPDRGLCGALNSNLCRRAYQEIRDLEGQGLSVQAVTIGRKSRDFLARRGVELIQSWTETLAHVSYQNAREIGAWLVDGYLAERFDRVVLVYANFKSVISQIVECRMLLPIAVETPSGAAPAAPVSYLFEPSDDEVLNELLPRYVEVQIFQALLESAASEHGARMTAMDAASRNAKEMIRKLTLVYNRTRQEAVTKELLDIIGGVEALKG